MEKIIVMDKEEKAKVLQRLSDLHQPNKIYSIEQTIDKFYDDVIQLEVMPQYDMDTDAMIKQCLRHGPEVLVIEEAR